MNFWEAVGKYFCIIKLKYINLKLFHDPLNSDTREQVQLGIKVKVKGSRLDNTKYYALR